MRRLTLPLLAAALFALNACSNSTTTDTAATTAAPADSTSMAHTASATADTAAATPTGSAKADPSGPTAPHSTDAEFMQSAAHSDQNEIQLSKLALSKGVTGMTKTFADQMIADHTKSTANLKPIAAKASVTLPSDMDAEHKQLAPQLQALSGKAFEDKYISQMVADHQKTANTMAAHQKMTKNAALQGFITTTLPVVESHLSMANKDASMKM